MPIDIATGNVHIERTDLSIPGRVDLVWSRRYSGTLLGNQDSLLGRGWTICYESTLSRTAAGFTFVTPTGTIEFLPDPDAMLERGGVLRHLGAGLEIFKKEGRVVVQHWDVTSGEVKRFGFLPQPGIAVWPMSTVEDLHGNRLDLRRDGKGRLLAVEQRVEGRSLRLLYNDAGRLDTVTLNGPQTDPVQVARYQYGPEGVVSAAFDGLDHAEHYSYDGAGRLVREVEKDGGVFSYRYDREGRCIWSSGLDHYDEKRLRFLTAIRVTEVTDSYGHTRRYQYLPTGQITNEWDPLGGEIRTTYDDFGRIVEVLGACGGSTQYEYDAAGNRSAFINAVGGIFLYEFNESHQATVITGPNGGKWRHSYDERNRLAASEDASGARWTLEYDPEGNLATLVSPDGRSRRFSYEKGVLSRVADWQGQVTYLHYDRFGRLETRRDPLGNTFGYFHDVVGNLVRLSLPDGGSLRAEYDAGGNQVRYEDAAGRVTKRRLGTCRRLVEEVDALGEKVVYHWGTEPGRLDAVTNELGELYRFTYDAAGRTIREVGFDGRELLFDYDASGRCVCTTNGAGESIEIERDLLGRVTAKKLSDGDVSRFAFDALGNLIEASNQECEIILERDAAGRLVREVQGKHWLRRESDAVGQTTRLETDLGLVLDYEYDGNGFWRFLHVNGRQAFAFQRDARGQEVTRALPGNAGSLRQEFDSIGRVVEQRLWPGQAGNHAANVSTARSARNLVSRRYRRDAGGLIDAIEDDVLGRTTYSYDLVERLREVVQENGPSERFGYDPAGNVIHIDGVQPRVDADLLYGPGNRLLRKAETEYEYDGAGRLIKKTVQGVQPEVWTFQWDALDRLRSIVRPDGVVWRYGYDALTRRVRKSGPDEEIHFVWHGNVPIHELSSRGTAKTWLFAQESFVPLGMVTDDRVLPIITDHLGTPREIVNGDGEVIWRLRTRAFGASVSETAQGVACPFRFQGQYRDEESGLHYNRFRYYDPDAGRFIQQDPLRFASTPNFYGYQRNPIGWIDPWGLCESFFRTMSKEDYEEFLKTGKVPATSETFISPTQGFSEDYDGVLVKFSMKPGTTEALEGIGVRDNSNVARTQYPDMPPVEKGWTKDKAFFKGEGDQVNIGLGKGTALGTFNQNIDSHEKVR